MATHTEDQPTQTDEETKVGLGKKVYYLFSLFRIYISIGFSVPFIAGAIFAYVSLGNTHGPPIYELIIPILVGFFMGCGFFALDSYHDIETDKYNPRQKSLPHALVKNLISKKSVLISVVIFFGLGIFLSGFATIFQIGTFSILHLIFASLGVAGGILYTTPPFRFKGRPALDILINVISFGIIGSLYGWTLYASILDLITPFGWFVIPVCCVITLLIVFPTPMIDYEPDKKANVKSTVVTLGLEKYAILGLIILGGCAIFMTFAEIRIFLDFNSFFSLNFGLGHLIGLLAAGYITFIPYVMLYRWPTPRTAFYVTGMVAVITFLGAIIAVVTLYML